MATAELEKTETTQAVVYAVTDTRIAELRNEFEGTTALTPKGYDECRRGIAICRTLRGEVEDKRVELKAASLAWGRKVDGEASRIKALLLEIEEPLKLAKQTVDDEKDRARREKEAAELAKIEAEAKAKRDAEDAAHRAEREAEAAKLAAERARLQAEQERIDAANAKLEALRKEQDERAAEERRKIEAERQAVEDQRRKGEQEEFERQAKIKAEEEARAKVERERVEGERRKQEEELRAAEQAKAIEALKPDKEKIRSFAARLSHVDYPSIKTAKAKKFMEGVWERLSGIISDCEQF